MSLRVLKRRKDLRRGMRGLQLLKRINQKKPPKG
jgi:hypothetical protein